jgi:NTE family protein
MSDEENRSGQSREMDELLGNMPVRPITGDPEGDEPEEGIALCLSGGGYRAMLFHLGTLWRLNDAGYLGRINRISSVSGGSITAGMLGLAWGRLRWEGGMARDFREQVANPVMNLGSKTIDIWATLGGLAGPKLPSDRIAGYYDQHLYKGATLQQLPDDSEEAGEKRGPRFVINATNVQSGALWRFSRPYMADYKVGLVPYPKVDLARAVAASSAFPPFLSPSLLSVRAGDYDPSEGTSLDHPPFTTDVVLTDGGVYDNMGLETAWKRYRTVLVSDAGAKMKPDPRPWQNWVMQFFRVRDIADDQVRNLRKRIVIAAYRLDESEEGYRRGAYWSIRGRIEDYGPKEMPRMEAPYETTAKLAEVATRLARLPARTRMQLVNWGYAICDAAMRAHVEPDLPLPSPGERPYPEADWGYTRAILPF